MEKINSAFRVFDIYGDYFYFRIANQSKYRTAIGGFLSFITLGIFIFITLEFGSNFMFNLNPSTSQGSVFFDLKNPPLYKDNYEENIFMLGFQPTFGDDIQMYFHAMNIDEKLIATYSDRIYPKKCNWTDIKSRTKYFRDIDINITLVESQYTFYCIRTNDFNLSTYTNPGQQSANSFILGYLGYYGNRTISALPVTTYFKKISFNPQNYDTPFESKYVYQRIYMVAGNVHEFTIYFEKTVLDDDKGWLLKTKKEKIELSSGKTEFRLIPLPDKSLTMKINIYCDETVRTYSRSYTKIQDLLAQIGGFMKVIFLLLNTLIFIIRTYKIDYFIYSKFIKDSEPQEEESIDKPRLEKSSEIKVNNFIRDDFKTMNRHNVSNFSQLQKKETIIDKNGLQKESNQTNTLNKTSILSSSEDLVENNKKNDKPVFSILRYLQCLYYDIMGGEIKNEEVKQLKLGIDICDRYRDVDFIIEKLHEVEILKRIILNEKQLISLELVNAPELFYTREVKQQIRSSAIKSLSLEDKKNEVIAYYIMKKNSMSFIDQNLLKMLPKSLRSSVLEEISDKRNINAGNN